MRNHFSYLLDDDAGAFFQKAANRAADPSPGPPPLAKTASVQTAFEKVASRLDRDLEIIQMVGPRGINAGMMKRADAYIDRLINLEDELTAEEFGEVFDKVAATAIMGDLEAAFAELTEGVEPELHGVVEQTLATIGSDLTSLALLEKQAILGALARVAGRVFTRGGGGELAAGRAVAKGMATRQAGRAATAVRGAASNVATKAKGAIHGIKTRAQGLGQEFRAGRQAKMMEARSRTSENLAKARQIAAGGGPNAVRAGDAAKALERQVGARPGAPASQAFLDAQSKSVAKGMEKTKASLAPKPSTSSPRAAPTNTTAPRERAATPAAAGEAKAIKADGERTKAQGDAAAAARKGKPDLRAIPGGKPDNDNLRGTGTDGPAPAPKPKADSSPAPAAKADSVPPPPGGATGKPPGFMDAWKKATTGGWSSLSPAEKGSLIRGGVTGAIVYRAVTGRGAVTGGEGVV
jgi:hypothetical protein